MDTYELTELESVPSLRQRTYAALAEMIMHRRLASGTHLKEDELARKLGVSRNPVREALQQLVHDGMADYLPSRGVFVHSPTAKEVSDVLHMRWLLETDAARLAAMHRTDDDLEELREIVRAGEAAAATKNLDQLVELNGRFHNTILRAADNDILRRSMNALRRRVLWYFAGVAVARSESSWAEHGAILDAIRDRNPEVARERMGTHVERTQSLIEKQIAWETDDAPASISERSEVSIP